VEQNGLKFDFIVAQGEIKDETLRVEVFEYLTHLSIRSICFNRRGFTHLSLERLFHGTRSFFVSARVGLEWRFLMVQFTLEQFQSFFGSLFSQGANTVLVLGGLALLLFLLTALLFRQATTRFAGDLKARGPLLWGWLLVLLAVATVWVGFFVVGQQTLARLSVVDHAPFSAAETPAVGRTEQSSPSVVYLTEKTYTRTLTLPPDLLRRITEQGVEVLAPYLADPSSENLLRLVDTFKRSGQQVVFSREATLQTENALPLQNSDLKVKLEFVENGRNSFYNADFFATYSFSNPLEVAVPGRFTFYLPEGSGTLRDFSMTVNGQPYRASDLSGGYVWEGTLEPKQKVDVVVKYKNKGAGGWNYLLTAKREPIERFALTLESNLSPKFGKGSLYPTSRAGLGLSGSSQKWNLENIITSQDIRLAFSSVPLAETLGKVFGFLPAALMLGLLAVGGWAWRYSLRVTPTRAAFGVLSFGLGWATSSVLLGYLPAWAALGLGALIAVVLSARALGSAFIVPLIFAAVTPLAFLVVGHAGLLLALLGVVALVLLMPSARARKASSLG